MCIRDRSEARRRFVDDASHQLRTPLATLATQVGFALRETRPEPRQDALLAIKAQLDETVRQTNQMLALARADSALLQPEPVSPGTLAEGVARNHWADAREKGIDLGFEMAPGDAALTVLAQPGLLKEALANLMHNALRHTPHGGQVTVQVRRDGDDALLTVLDNGPGMTAEQRTHAGERFYRAGNTALPGSGLGLAIVQSICTRHGGALQIEASPDGPGLAVSMRLPLAPPIDVGGPADR